MQSEREVKNVLDEQQASDRSVHAKYKVYLEAYENGADWSKIKKEFKIVPGFYKKQGDGFATGTSTILHLEGIQDIVKIAQKSRPPILIPSSTYFHTTTNYLTFQSAKIILGQASYVIIRYKWWEGLKWSANTYDYPVNIGHSSIIDEVHKYLYDLWKDNIVTRPSLEGLS